MIRALIRLVSPIKNKVLSVAGRAHLETLDDGSPVQAVKILAGKDEILGQVERIQNFGFTGAAPKGSDAIFLCPQGIRSHAIVVACDHREHRKRDLKEGESAQYDAFGKWLYFRDDGTIEIHGEDLEIIVEPGDQGGAGKVKVTAESDVEVETQGSAKVTAAGDIELTADGNVSVEGSDISLSGTTVEITATATLSLTASATVTIEAGASVTIEGVTVSVGSADTVVNINGLNFLEHKHTDVESGSSNSGAVFVPA